MVTLRTDPAPHDWPVATRGQLLWTGHQATLWHPGILAKYLAVDAVAGDRGGHIVVDQDVYHPLRIDLPTRNGKQVGMRSVELAPIVEGVPIASQPAVDTAGVVAQLRSASSWCSADLSTLIAAFEASHGPSSTLAQQMHAVLWALLSPWVGEWVNQRLVYGSTLLSERGNRGLIERLVREAPVAVRAYNDAVSAFPDAGMTAMRVERERIELPMWWLPWSAARQKVFADISDSMPMLVKASGEPIDLAVLNEEGVHGDARLAPRALLMTAMLRMGDDSAGFVHGTGGYSYDRVTQRWCEAWLAVKLSPKLLTTADVRLPMDVPVASREDWAKSVWYRHWLQSNVDRAAGRLDAGLAALAREKQELLRTMHDDRDRARRAAQFARVHAINAELCAAEPAMMESAQRDVEQAQLGVRNAAVATRRDWSFALYPAEQIASLRDQVRLAMQQRQEVQTCSTP